MKIIEIPYRLDSLEAIEQAKWQNLFDLGDAYKQILKAFHSLPLERPLALLQAREVVTKDFPIFIQEEETQHLDLVFEEMAFLDLAANFQTLADKIPWVREIARYRDLFCYLESFPPEVGEAWKLGAYPKSLTAMYEMQINVRRLVKRELLRFVTGGNKNPADADRAKQLLVALTLFDTAQKDVLQALRTDDHGTGEYPILCQNAYAELLFVRIPKKMHELLVTAPLTIRRKLFHKIERLGLPVRQRMNIFGYFKASGSHDELLPVLKKINGVITMLSMPAATKGKLTNYIDSLIQVIENVPLVYHKLFLNRELAVLRRMNKTGAWLKSTITYGEKILATFMQSVSLDFYPTKDYLELYKSLASSDCTSEDACAEEHLKTPNYFTIRIFLGGLWIGNIYMLDFVKEQGVLLIDRIQVPRNLKLFYHHFFERLTEVLQELFADVPYKFITAPLTISNHMFLQTVFYSYRKKLSSVNLSFKIPHGIYFESLQKNRRYHILATKETFDKGGEK